MFIKDERKRMIAYLSMASRMCNDSCNNCSGKDNRLYNKPVIDYLREEYGMVGNLTGACSIGLALGMRLEEYGLKNPSNYHDLIISVAKNLKENSVGTVNPEKIKSNLGFLRAFLNLSNTISKEKTIKETVIIPEVQIPNTTAKTPKRLINFIQATSQQFY